MPQRVQLGFRTLAELADGTVDVMLQRHLQRIAQDCLDRPGDPSKRKVSLDFLCQPVIAQDGECETVKIEVECTAKVPVFRTRPYEMVPTKAGFLFNIDDPDAVDQEVLFPRSADKPAG